MIQSQDVDRDDAACEAFIPTLELVGASVSGDVPNRRMGMKGGKPRARPVPPQLVWGTLGVLAVIGGIWGSFVWDTPSGPSVVVTAFLIFAASLLVPVSALSYLAGREEKPVSHASHRLSSRR